MLRSKLPAGFVVPAQPVERAAPPSGADWVHEIKHDGYRIIVRRDGDCVRLYSRKAINWTARPPASQKARDGLRPGASRSTARRSWSGRTGSPISRRCAAGGGLYAFDLLEYDGSDLRRMPLETRKATLASLLKQSGVIRFSEHIAAEGPDVFAHACRLGAEGIVSSVLARLTTRASAMRG
jgi:bifunctional non-homologous end joining protein LigD